MRRRATRRCARRSTGVTRCSPLDEQAVLRRLAVFAGSFRLDMAQAVATANGLDEWAALDALAALVDKSLVQLEGVEPPALSTARDHAHLRVRAIGGRRRNRVHAACVTAGHGAARRAVEREYWPMADSPWLARYAPDYDDMQAAFERACARGDAEIAAATSEALLWMD